MSQIVSHSVEVVLFWPRYHSQAGSSQMFPSVVVGQPKGFDSNVPATGSCAAASSTTPTAAQSVSHEGDCLQGQRRARCFSRTRRSKSPA